MTSRRSLLMATPALAFMPRESRAQLAADSVKIGVLGDHTTFGADAGGMGSVIAARMAAADHGGRAAGKPVEIIYADFGDKPDVATTIAQQWLDRGGVHAIADMTLSSAALAVQDIVRERRKTLLIAGAATSDLTGRACSPFATHWADDTYVLATNVARGLVESGRKTWYFISPNYTLGASLERDATEAITSSGGRVLGRVSHPVQETEYSSLLLRAQSSRADVIALTSTGINTVNQIKQASEFGLMKGSQRVAGFLIFITDIHGIGLETAQGLNIVDGFYWDQNESSRAFGRRFLAQHGRMPTKQQAATYASVAHYLKAVEASGSVEGETVNARMRVLPVDYFGKAGSIRPDGRVIYDVTLYEVKSPAESRYPWDYYKPVRQLPGGSAFRPLGSGGCTL